MIEQLLTVDDVAKALRLSKFSIYRLAESREISSVKIGKRRLFREIDIEKFIEKNLQETIGE